MKNELTVESAIAFLTENGYYTETLWHVNDVKAVCKCTDAEALEVLENSLSNEYIMAEINYAIRDNAESMGLEMIEDDESDDLVDDQN